MILRNSDCDLISINESWLKSDDDLNIEGFTWLDHRRKTLNRRARIGSGGVGFLIKSELYRDYTVELTDKAYEGILAITLTNKHTDYKFAFITAYLPPVNSIYGRDSIQFFSHLTHLMYSFSDLDATYIAGDLNGRIGDKSDFIDGIDCVPARIAIDSQVLGHGDAILDFCNESKFCVINGRISPLNDNFTSLSNRGSAVVDYMLTPYDSLDTVCDFKVVTMSSAVESLGTRGLLAVPSKITDHSMLIIDVLVRDAEASAAPLRCRQSAPMHGAQSAGSGPALPPRFNIDNVPNDFMSSPEARHRLLALIEDIENHRITQNKINHVYDQFVETFIVEMRSNFREINTLPMCRRKMRFTKKEWWDDELAESFKCMQKAEHEYIRAKKNKIPHNAYFSIYKCKQDVFDKMLKKKKRNFKNSQSLKLEEVNSSDPNSFWEYIKKLGPTKKPNKIPFECYSDDGNVIYDFDKVPEKWKTEFESLYCPSLEDVTPAEMEFKQQIIRENMEFEMQPCDNSNVLNEPLTSAEVLKVVNKSKLHKAAGLDGIVYDVLKNEAAVCIMTKLFNLCFVCHMVPDHWVQALIFPIPKSRLNDPRVPLNYRLID